MEKNGDRDTLRDIRNGHIEAFSVLVKKYTPSIMKLCRLKTPSLEDAQDLTQNTFISLYKSIGRLDIDKPVLPYLYMIARNELKMYYRSRTPTVSLNDKISETATESRQDEALMVPELLDGLSPDQKKAIQMVYEGYSYQEISEVLNKPINTVRTIIRRARLAVTKKQTP